MAVTAILVPYCNEISGVKVLPISKACQGGYDSNKRDRALHGLDSKDLLTRCKLVQIVNP